LATLDDLNGTWKGQAMADYDSPWKEVLDRFFALVLAFLLPRVYRDIDWTVDPESLETELRKVLPESEVGLKRVDKLVKVVRKNTGDPALLHVEAQMSAEEGFERRVYVYSNKSEDLSNLPVVSIAILGDDRPDWHPRQYRFALWGCTKTFKFVSIKLLKWRGKEGRLEKHRNPFAVFLLAHLQALATRNDLDKRAEWKEQLMVNLAERKLDSEDRREWLRLIDWLLELPRERNVVIWQRIWTLLQQKEKTMPFVDYFQEREQEAEKLGLERGEKLGLERGEKLGLERGEKLGLERGEKRGLRQAIQAILSAQLPAQEKGLMVRVERIDDLDVLRRVLLAASAKDVAELNRLLP
jgi:hypothetical protein